MKALVALLCLTLWDPVECSLCPWNSPGKDTRVGSHSLLQGISPTQGLNLGLPHCRQILYRLSHQGSLKAVKGASQGINVWSSKEGAHLEEGPTTQAWGSDLRGIPQSLQRCFSQNWPTAGDQEATHCGATVTCWRVRTTRSSKTAHGCALGARIAHGNQGKNPLPSLCFAGHFQCPLLQSLTSSSWEGRRVYRSKLRYHQAGQTMVALEVRGNRLMIDALMMGGGNIDVGYISLNFFITWGSQNKNIKWLQV